MKFVVIILFTDCVFSFHSVQFMNDSYSTTQKWVEEGQKHLSSFEPVPDNDLTFGDQLYESDASCGFSLEHSPPPRVRVESPYQDGSHEDELVDNVAALKLDEDVDFTNGLTSETTNGITNGTTYGEMNGETGLTNGVVGNEQIAEAATANEENEKSENTESGGKSWASLFKASGAAPAEGGVPSGFVNGRRGATVAEVPAVRVETPVKSVAEERRLSLIPMDTDTRATKLADAVSHWYPDYSRTHIQLHGLINRSNWCYINASLQALLAIPTIYHFFKNLKEFLNHNAKETSTPLTDSMIAFFNRFEPVEVIHAPGRRESEEVNYGAPYEPKCVYEVLSVMKSSLSEKGRQEDAEEFLSFLLNGIHDELVALNKLAEQQPGSATPELTNGDAGHDSEVEMAATTDDEDSWEEVGPKNRIRTTRKAVIEGSLIKHVFGGVYCSSVLQTGVKESTTFQPFFTLQLDIQNANIQTLSDAIHFYFMKEKLQGFTCSKTKTEVDASRRISLEELPLMFIFHLKYFVFDPKGGGSQKLHKEIEIPVDLEIPREIISTGKLGALNNMRRYKLHAIVYHHGGHAAGGHYTAAVHHPSPCGWVHFDDNQIKTINMSETKHVHGAVPYLVFYERLQPR